MVPNPDQQEADQERMQAHLSGQHTSLTRCMVGKLAAFSIVLGTGLKRFEQRMRSEQIPTKSASSLGSPHH